MRVDIKALLNKLNPLCTRALHAAAGRSVAGGHFEVTPEHLFRELLEEDQGDWCLILAGKGLDRSRLRRELDAHLASRPAGNTGRPVFAPSLLDLLQDAWAVASIELAEPLVRSGAVLAALADRLPASAGAGHLELLKALRREALVGDFGALAAGSAEGGGATSGAEAREGFLERYCIDFTRRAREGGIDPVFGRDGELRQIIDILARRRKNNPICVGEPGVGKTAVVEGLALRIVEGRVPATLQGVALLALDLGLLEAGAGMKGEFESRLKGVLRELAASPRPTILFVDEAHTLIGAGGAPGGGDAANLLKPALARGEVRTIAATTWTEYRKYFEKDPALARRFQLVQFHAPDVAATVRILRGIRPHYERAHGVIIRDDALAAAAELSDRFLQGRLLPDKAIDLLDTSCARIKVNLTAPPAELEALEHQAQALALEKAGLERDLDHGAPVDPARLPPLEADLERTLAAAAALEGRWAREKEAVERLLALRSLDGRSCGAASAREALGQLEAARQGAPLLHYEVEPEVVARVVSDWTGIPLGRVLRDEAAGILALEDRLGARILGQDHALRVLSEGIRTAKAGLRDPRQPLGVYLLAGPSGTGKTETGLALADLLFGSERSLVVVNLSEFQEAHSVSRLVGSPPGYVGHGDGGMLTEAVRQRPYAVVLLDEAEKAHGDVLNLFHQVFDKGVLTDGQGREVSFRNTVLLLTTNQAGEAVRDLHAAGARGEDLAAAIRPVLARAFQPSLLARMTVVPFLPLEPEALRRIARQKLERLRETLAAGRRLALDFTPQVADLVARRCGSLDTGARGIDAILGAEILPRLAREVLGRLGEGRWPAVTVAVGKDGDVAFRFREEPRSRNAKAGRKVATAT